MAHLGRPNLELFLQRLTNRSVLTNDEQQAILGLAGHAQQVTTNRDFVPLGECVDHVSLVMTGMVGRFDQNGEGSRQITAMHIAGDICDLHSVVQPMPTSALQALCTSTILRIPHGAIRSAARSYPAIAEAFWRDCMVDAAILSEWVVNVGRRDARTRVAHLICEMATRLGVTANRNDIVFDFPVTQTQLAEATALTAVHVNRTLQGLRADGLVEWHQGLVRLPRWDALAEIAEFDPAYLQSDVRPEQRLRIVAAN